MNTEEMMEHLKLHQLMENKDRDKRSAEAAGTPDEQEDSGAEEQPDANTVE